MTDCVQMKCMFGQVIYWTNQKNLLIKTPHIYLNKEYATVKIYDSPGLFTFSSSVSFGTLYHMRDEYKIKCVYINTYMHS